MRKDNKSNTGAITTMTRMIVAEAAVSGTQGHVNQASKPWTRPLSSVVAKPCVICNCAQIVAVQNHRWEVLAAVTWALDVKPTSTKS